MILMGNSKVVWEGRSRKAPPYPDSTIKNHLVLI